MAASGRKELAVSMLALAVGLIGLAAWLGPRIGRDRDSAPADLALVIPPADGRPLPPGAIRLGFARGDKLHGRTEVHVVSFSHDGKLILAADWTGAANMKGFQFWEADTGKLHGEVETPIRALFGGSLSPDRSLVAWAGNDGIGAFGVTEVATQKVLWRAKDANHISFTPDGKHVVAGQYGWPTLVADARTGNVRPLSEPKRFANSFVMSHDGTTVVAAAEDYRDARTYAANNARIEVWDVATATLRKVVARSDYPFGGRPILAISADGRTVGYSAGKKFTLIDVASGTKRWEIENPGGNHVWEAASLSPAGDVMFAARTNYDGVPVTTLELLDARTGRTVRVLDGEAYQFCQGTFSPDGKRLVTFGQSIPVRVWDVASGRLLPAYDGHRTPVQSLVVSDDGGTIASSDRYAVCLWDGVSGSLRKRFDLRFCGSVGMTADGRTLLATHEQTTQLVDALSGSRRVFVRYHSQFSAISPDGTKVAVSQFGGMVEILDRASGNVVLTIAGHPGEMYAMAFAADGRRLLTAAHSTPQGPAVGFNGPAPPILDDTVRAWDLADGRELRKWEVKANCAAISPDGRTLFAGCEDGRVLRMDVESGKKLDALALHKGPVSAVAVSANGLAASADGAGIAVWKAFTGSEVKRLTPDHGATRALAFAASGRRLASTGTDGTILVWPASGW